MTPEGRVKVAVKKVLKKYPTGMWTFWPVQTGYGKRTLDCIGCYQGYPFAIETKSPGKTLTDMQVLEQDTMELAGMPVFVIGETLITGKLRYSNLSLLDRWLASK